MDIYKLIAVFVVVFFILVSAPSLALDDSPSPVVDSPDLHSTTLVHDGATYSIANYSVMALNDTPRYGETTPSLNVGAATEMQYTDAAWTLSEYKVTGSLEDAADQEERERILGDATREVLTEAQLLTEREEQARTQYLNDQLTTREFVLTSAKIAHDTDRLHAYISAIQPLTNDASNRAVLQNRLSEAQGITTGLTGPVRHHSLTFITGERTPEHTAIGVSSEGAVFSVIVNDRYFREVYRSDGRSGEVSSDVGLIDAVEQFQEEYPMVAEAETGMDIGSIGAPAREIFTFRVQLPEGSMVLYYEQSTEHFYYESSEWALDRLEPEAGVIAVENETRVVVNETFSGGPVKISAFDNSTNEPVSVPVLVGDSQLKQTDSTGLTWAIAPYEQYSITVMRDTGNATITVPQARSVNFP